MKVSLEKKYFFSSIIVLTLSSCGWILEDHRYDYLKERQSEPIKSSSEESTRPIVDYYPIPNTDRKSSRRFLSKFHYLHRYFRLGQQMK